MRRTLFAIVPPTARPWDAAVADAWSRVWRKDYSGLRYLLMLGNPERYLREPLVVEAILALRLECVSASRANRDKARLLFRQLWALLVPSGRHRVDRREVEGPYRALLAGARAVRPTSVGPAKPIRVWTLELGRVDLPVEEREHLWAEVHQGAHLPTGRVPPGLTLEHCWEIVGTPTARGAGLPAEPRVLTELRPDTLGFETRWVACPSDPAFSELVEARHAIHTDVRIPESIQRRLTVTVKKPGQRRGRATLTPSQWARQTAAQLFGISPSYIQDLLKPRRRRGKSDRRARSSSAPSGRAARKPRSRHLAASPLRRSPP